MTFPNSIREISATPPDLGDARIAAALSLSKPRHDRADPWHVAPMQLAVHRVQEIYEAAVRGIRHGNTQAKPAPFCHNLIGDIVKRDRIPARH